MADRLARRDRLGIARVGVEHGDRVVDPVVTGVERRQRAEDHLPVLDGVHVAGGERSPVTIAVDGQDGGPVHPARAQEVAVDRMGNAVVADRRRRGGECLSRDLAAEQPGRQCVFRVLGAEQVRVEGFERQQVDERRRL